MPTGVTAMTASRVATNSVGAAEDKTWKQKFLPVTDDNIQMFLL